MSYETVSNSLDTAENNLSDLESILSDYTYYISEVQDCLEEARREAKKLSAPSIDHAEIANEVIEAIMPVIVETIREVVEKQLREQE